MKRFAIVAGIAVAAAGIYAAYSHWFAMHRVTLPLVEPAPDPLGAINQAFPPRTSQIVVTARMPFAKIKELAEKAIPAGFHDEQHLPDSNGFSGIIVRPNLSRDPLNLSLVANSSPAKCQLSVGFHGSVGAEAFKWIIIKPPLLPTIKTKSPTVSGTVNLSGDIHGWLSLGLDPHWNLTHDEHLDVTVGQAEITLLGFLHISVQGRVQDAVNHAAPGMIKSALDNVRDRIAIRPAVNKIWKQAFVPVKISAHPNAYAVLTPSKLRLQKLAVDDVNYVSVRAAIEGSVVTAIVPESPLGAPPTELPDLEIDSHIDPTFHVLLPVGLALSEVNAALKDQLGHQRVELNKDVSLGLSNLSLYSKAGTLFAKVDVDAENKEILRRVTGTLFLKCGVIYDAHSQQLRLKGVDFSVETKSLLTRLAAWLLTDTICRRVEESAKLDIGARLRQLQSQVNSQYGTVAVAPDVTLQPHLDEITFEGVRVSDNLITAGFDLSGNLSCQVNLPAQ